MPLSVFTTGEGYWPPAKTIGVGVLDSQCTECPHHAQHHYCVTAVEMMMFPNFITARWDSGAQAEGHSERPWQSPAHTQVLTLGGHFILLLNQGQVGRGMVMGNEARRQHSTT